MHYFNYYLILKHTTTPLTTTPYYSSVSRQQLFSAKLKPTQRPSRTLHFSRILCSTNETDMFKKILSDPCCRWICLGWGGFTLENLILSENRTEIIEYFGKHGDATYHRIYNTLSTLACASVAFGYLRYRPGIQYIKRISNLRLALGFTIASVGACGITQLAPKFQVVSRCLCSIQ